MNPNDSKFRDQYESSYRHAGPHDQGWTATPRKPCLHMRMQAPGGKPHLWNAGQAAGVEIDVLQSLKAAQLQGEGRRHH